MVGGPVIGVSTSYIAAKSYRELRFGFCVICAAGVSPFQDIVPPAFHSPPSSSKPKTSPYNSSPNNRHLNLEKVQRTLDRTLDTIMSARELTPPGQPPHVVSDAHKHGGNKCVPNNIYVFYMNKRE